jgi:hypothetical protein
LKNGKEAEMSHCTWNRVSWQISSIRKSLGQREGLPFADLLMPEMLQEVEVVVHRDGFKPVTMILVTTLLDAKKYRSNELAELYWQRWQAELDLRSIKETMQMEELRCKTPAMARKELWTHLLACNLIRGLIAHAAVEHDTQPCRISFKGALQTLIAFQPAFLLPSQYSDEIYRRLLKAIATHGVGDRPNRVEPRAKKNAARRTTLFSCSPAPKPENVSPQPLKTQEVP